MQQQTMSHVPTSSSCSLEYEANEGKRQRANPEEEARRKQQKSIAHTVQNLDV